MAYYFDDVAQLRDLEGAFLGEQLVSDHSQGPDVDGLVVLALGHHFRGEVERSAAEGEPHFLVGVVDGPAEVAELDAAALREREGTMVRRMFSGLMSLWMIAFLWMWRTASLTCVTSCAAFSWESCLLA